MQTCKTCGHELIAVEYSYADPCRYDGVSEYWCRECDVRTGRWTGKVLKADEHEPPFGKQHRRGCKKLEKKTV